VEAVREQTARVESLSLEFTFVGKEAMVEFTESELLIYGQSSATAKRCKYKVVLE
jgi:hypothetical protein